MFFPGSFSCNEAIAQVLLPPISYLNSLLCTVGCWLISGLVHALICSWILMSILWVLKCKGKEAVPHSKLPAEISDSYQLCYYCYYYYFIYFFPTANSLFPVLSVLKTAHWHKSYSLSYKPQFTMERRGPIQSPHVWVSSHSRNKASEGSVVIINRGRVGCNRTFLSSLPVPK